MDDRQLEKLERFFLILSIAGGILVYGTLWLAWKLGLADPNLVVQAPPFLFAMGAICVSFSIWWLITIWLLLKNSTTAFMLFLNLYLFLDRIIRKIRGNGR